MTERATEIRWRVIRELVAGGTIRTQKDLQNGLRQKGLPASPITISRDLRELGVVKSREVPGRAVYRFSGRPEPSVSRAAFLVDRMMVVAVDRPREVAEWIERARIPEVMEVIPFQKTVWVAVMDKGMSRVRRLLSRWSVS